MEIKQGNIYLAALDPVMGKEIVRTHHVVVISNDLNNEYAKTVTVLPLSFRNLEKIYPFEVFLPKDRAGLSGDSKVKADQIRTIDKKRLVALMGGLNDTDMRQVEEALKIHLATSV